MRLRFFAAASLSLSLCSLAGPLGAMAQAAPSDSNVSPAPLTVPSEATGSLLPITVQIAPPPISISSAVLGLAGPLGAQAAPGKPIFAEFLTVHHQNFTDGNQISHTTTSSIYRDTQGRIRRESQLSLAGMPAGVSASTFITIVDHQLGFGYVLDPQEMVAHRYELNGAGPSYVARLSAQGNGNAFLAPDPKQPAESVTVPEQHAASESHWRLHAFSRHNRGSQDAAASSHQLSSSFIAEGSAPNAPSVRIDQPFLAAPNPVRTENLGEQMILGFRTRGTRVITTLPAGQIGNDRPIDIVSEQWFSPELELVMRSAHRDPWAGEFTTTVTRISRGDQAATLFEVPERYRVIDAAKEGEHHVLDGHGNHSPGPAPW
jgi:hypothetical protein